MAFGYALLKGRGGASGYVRENGDQREVSARDLPPGTACALYARKNGEYSLCGTETADSNGNAKWTAPKEGQLFIATGDRVLLWDGGDETFLQASAWLNRPKSINPQKPEQVAETEEIPEARLNAEETKESPPERAYTLRPAGNGEPVDTLPER